MISCIFAFYIALCAGPAVGASRSVQAAALLSRNSDSSHKSRAGHPAWRRCSSLTYSRYARSSRLASRAPRSGTYATNHCCGTQDDDPDALYAQREDLRSAQRAESIWAQRLANNPKDFESAWKLARARYWLGGHALDADRKVVLEKGIAAGRSAVAIDANRPEGHFWIAANMGALAEAFGMRQGLKYRGDIKSALLTVLKLAPGFQQGSADRALGRWYYKVPGLFGGSKTKSEEHLRRSLSYAPNSTASHFFLAEMLLDSGRRDEGRAELQRVLDAPLDPDWTPEDREFKEKARRLLNSLTGKR